MLTRSICLLTNYIIYKCHSCRLHDHHPLDEPSLTINHVLQEKEAVVFITSSVKSRTSAILGPVGLQGNKRGSFVACHPGFRGLCCGASPANPMVWMELSQWHDVNDILTLAFHSLHHPTPISLVFGTDVIPRRCSFHCLALCGDKLGWLPTPPDVHNGLGLYLNVC